MAYQTSEVDIEGIADGILLSVQGTFQEVSQSCR
jgi:hypothetical protein